jgi:hypothetical protein
MSAIKSIFTKTALFLFIFLPLQALAQSGPVLKEEEIQAMMDKMEADLAAIARAAGDFSNSGADINQEAAQDISPQDFPEAEIPEIEEPVKKSIQAARPFVPAQTENVFRQSGRDNKIELTMRNIAIEISFEYFFSDGYQKFEAISDVDGSKVSQVEFPNIGQIPIIKGEITFLPGISLGGKFATSTLSKKVGSDEDWNLWVDINHVPTWVDYQITKQYDKPTVEFYDINLYYNLFDSTKDKTTMQDSAYENLLIDRFSLDVFSGYQSYKGRHRMIDPLSEYVFFSGGIWQYFTGLPADVGFNAFYKVEYKGPRLGLRAKGSKGKVSTRLSFALAWLETKSYGYWNLRDYSFWFEGKSGLGTDFEFETTYAFNPSWSAGFGYNYMGFYQRKMKASGREPPVGGAFDDLDIIRNSDCKMYGPKFLLKYIW